MDPKWIQVVLLLVFYQKTIGNCIEVKEGDQVVIRCKPENTAMIIWFRILDTSGMEFIVSFSSNGMEKATGTNFSQIFSHSNNPYSLTLKSFKKSRDSGVYSCGSLYKGIQLKFGEVTRLSGGKRTPTTAAPTVAQQPPATTPARCDCGDKNTRGQVLGGTTSPSFACPLIILGPLAGGCGILLLLLLITTIYCNRIRTRRCPHHYKRKPRGAAHEKQLMANRHV